MRPAHELAEIIERFGNSYTESHHPNTYVQRVLHAIKQCRTSVMGGHIDRCEACGHMGISYNSCRNRHCPKCQNTQREDWIEARKKDLLPVPVKSGAKCTTKSGVKCTSKSGAKCTTF